MSRFYPYYETLDGRIVKEEPEGQYKGIWRQVPVHNWAKATGVSWYYQAYSFYSMNDNPTIPVNDSDLPKALQLWEWLKGD